MSPQTPRTQDDPVMHSSVDAQTRRRGNLEFESHRTNAVRNAEDHPLNPPVAAAAHAHDEEDSIGSRHGAGHPHWLWLIVVVLLAAGGFGALFVLGWLPSTERRKELDVEAGKVKSTAPQVVVITPEHASGAHELNLPCEIEAVRETQLYARTSGYLKKLDVDIGDHVDAGQLLATIDSPEIDTQLLRARASQTQAEAALAQARAQREQVAAAENQSAAQLVNLQATEELAKLTMDRYDGLRGKGIVSDLEITQQEATLKVARAAVKAGEAGVKAAKASTDAALAAVHSAEANVGVAKADVERYEVLKSFEKVTAPFAGIVVARQTEIGALVTEGSGTTAQPLFQLALTDPVRLFVDVPQSHAPAIKVDQPVVLTVREFPGRTFSGKVTRTSQAIDPASRTMRTEVEVPNKNGELLRGMYAQAKLNVNRATPIFLLPAPALIVNAAGTQVALVREGRIHFEKIAVEGDYGAKIAVSLGLKEEDAVVTNPSERLVEGLAVRATRQAPPAK